MTNFVFSSPPLSFPPKSPDDGKHGSSKEDSAKLKVSFQDKVLGDGTSRSTVKRDWFAEKLFRVEYKNGDPLAPMIHVDDKVFQELCEPWRDALVIKLLGKSIGYKIMKERVTKLWKLQAGFELRDMGHGFFMVKFDIMEDRAKVMQGGPWMIFYHYLVVST